MFNSFVCLTALLFPPADTIRTEIYTGRPLRVRKTPFIMEWENEKREEKKKLLASGVIPVG